MQLLGALDFEEDRADKLIRHIAHICDFVYVPGGDPPGHVEEAVGTQHRDPRTKANDL